VIEPSSLGDRSYLATVGAVAVVVDPQRDIDRILERWRPTSTMTARPSARAGVVSGAQLKVVAALPVSLCDVDLAAAQRFHLDTSTWPRAPDPPPLLGLLAAAAWWSGC
jgi:hypothetical protein